jgi:hypothetical protein
MSALESSPSADATPRGLAPEGQQEQDDPSILGRFRYDVLTDTWWWSEEMFDIHGLEGERPLTTDSILALKHPDDRSAVETTLRSAMETGGTFTQPHRVVGVDGAVRQVISVGEGIVLGGRVVAVHGYMVDVTDSVGRQVKANAWEEASRVIDQRAVIERAKGALMVRYGLDADAAFALLRTWSSTRNEKLRDVARHVVDNL